MGRLTVLRLVEDGWRVAAVDLGGPALEALHPNDQVSTFACDVSDLAQVRATATAVLAAFGQVDRLVTAAGIAAYGRIGEVSTERVLQVMDVNYAGTVAWVNELLPTLRASNGDLVIYASLAGWIVTPGYGPYTASKFALVGFAETLAEETRGTGLTVRCVCPPAVKTPMLTRIVADGQSQQSVDRSRPLTPEKVVDVVERSLARRRRSIWVFPGPAGFVWRLRRWSPRTVNALAGKLGA